MTVENSEELLVVVYDQLRSLARTMMSRERRGHTLQTTALVHEAYLRLSEKNPARWQNRHHFYLVAAQAMRRILVERARRRARPKHGGDQKRVPLVEGEIGFLEENLEMVNFDEAIRRFALLDPRAAQLVTLRYFAGLSLEEAAATLDISLSTARRDWNYAAAWLYRAMGSEEGQDGEPT